MNPILSVVIVNYNTEDMIVRCLSAVQSQQNITFEIIVSDNASQDNSCQVVRDKFPEVKLIENKINLGFGKANNEAIKICTGQYIYFLNPDTEVMQGAFRTMVDFMELNPDIGLAGTHIVYPDGSQQHSVHQRYPGEKHSKKTFANLKGKIAWVKGASMIVRKSVYQAVGGFDERFFLYSEECDLCLSIRKSGWEIGYIPEATVIHWRGKSERGNLPTDVWRKKFDALMLFYKKHYSEKTISAIRRSDIIKAVWRICTLWLTVPFCRDKIKTRNKISRYRIYFEKIHNIDGRFK